MNALLVTGLMMLAVPMTAHAKISDWVRNAGDEVVIIVNVLVLIFGAVGIVLTAIGIISYMLAKKHKRELDGQHWFILGGVLCILLVPLTMALGSSIAGDDQTNAADSFLEGNSGYYRN